MLIIPLSGKAYDYYYNRVMNEDLTVKQYKTNNSIELHKDNTYKINKHCTKWSPGTYYYVFLSDSDSDKKEISESDYDKIKEKSHEK